jgi:beta-lactamase superfamily II metal-dependent hydrolase
MRKLLPGILLLAAAAALPAAGNLEIYFIDVEGGQSTLFVAPSGESMLVDTGWAGFNRRDPGRIAAAARAAGVKRIDYLVVTHSHAGHAGGVPQLAERLPIRNFVDHGAQTETTRDAQVLVVGQAVPPARCRATTPIWRSPKKAIASRSNPATSSRLKVSR